jgi:hypothetical protein
LDLQEVSVAGVAVEALVVPSLSSRAAPAAAFGEAGGGVGADRTDDDA